MLERQSTTAIFIFSCLLLFGELFGVSLLLDARSLVLKGGVSGWRTVFGHIGSVAKIVTLAGFIFLFIIKPRLLQYWSDTLEGLSIKRFAVITAIQISLYAAFFALSQQIYGTPQLAMSVSAQVYMLWLVSLLGLLICWLLAIWKLDFLLQFIKREKWQLLFSVLTAVVIWWLSTLSSKLWGPMSEGTFYLSAKLLGWFSSQPIYSDPQEKILGVGEFFVNIAPSCSGYEGIGLVTAFLAIYLYTHKDEFNFPRAFILFPIAALIIWLLNALRIAVLVLIGEVSPEIAVGGFHSQAGWITFIITSLGLSWIAGKIPFFLREQPVAVSQPAPATTSVAIATLIPFIGLMAAVLLTSAFIAEFDWLYPLRPAIVLIALIFVWKTLDLKFFVKPHWLTLPIGIGVAVIWAMATPQDPNIDHLYSTSLSNASNWLAIFWLISRFLGTTIAVPIVEELVFRGYLLSKLANSEVKLHGNIPVTIMAIAGNSIAFGLLHNAWLLGTFAGLVYSWLRIKSQRIEDPILAHGLTNALLFWYALSTDHWSLL